MSDGPWLTRRRLLGLGVTSVAGMAVYSGEIARHEMDIREVPVRIPLLPDAFHGFRIVQISDIHFKEYTEEFFLRRVLRKVNDLKPDMVVVTGDYISMGPKDAVYGLEAAYECGDVLRMITCPMTYGVLGNHDHFVNEDGVARAVASDRFRVLRDQSVPIERDGKRIWLCGLNDCGWGGGDVEKGLPMSARSKDEPVIVLAHEPDYIDEMRWKPASQFVSLVLSGHTHGGQVRLPFMRPIQRVLPPLGKKYVEGLFRFDELQLYVNRGIGATGVPFRLNCPPEITVLTLQQGV